MLRAAVTCCVCIIRVGPIRFPQADSAGEVQSARPLGLLRRRSVGLALQVAVIHVVTQLCASMYRRSSVFQDTVRLLPILPLVNQRCVCRVSYQFLSTTPQHRHRHLSHVSFNQGVYAELPFVSGRYNNESCPQLPELGPGQAMPKWCYQLRSGRLVGLSCLYTSTCVSHFRAAACCLQVSVLSVMLLVLATCAIAAAKGGATVPARRLAQTVAYFDKSQCSFSATYDFESETFTCENTATQRVYAACCGPRATGAAPTRGQEHCSSARMGTALSGAVFCKASHQGRPMLRQHVAGRCDMLCLHHSCGPHTVPPSRLRR